MLRLKAPMSTSNHVALDGWITPREAAERLGVTQDHVRHLARKGILSGRRFGYGWLLTQESVEAYASTERRPGPKPDQPSKTE
jgi:excisionase family DNA binding protein